MVVLGLVGTTAPPAFAAIQTSVPPTSVVIAAPRELRATRDQLLDRVRRGEFPSLAIGVLQGGRVVWEEAMGWADREAKAAATPETVYPVASVSKSITATGALALVARGRLRLDQSPGPLLADDSADSVRVSHLLGHTSGVPHIWHYEYPDRPATAVERTRLIRDNAILVASPGERFLYSNLGYGILAQLVEQAGSAAFQQVMEHSLFGPLGMRSTTTDAWVGGEGTVRGYEADGAAIPYRFRLAPDGGAGFFSNLHDLLRYARFHLGNLKTAAVSKDAAIATAMKTLRPERNYLRGWGVVPVGDANVLISDGQMAGGTAVAVLVPEREVAVVALCNATGCPTSEVTVTVLGALIPGFAEQFAAATAAVEREVYAPGTMPEERFEGSLFEGETAVPISADFSDPAAPVVRLGTTTYRLQDLRWDRGTLEATALPSSRAASGSEQRPGFLLLLWLRGNDLRGVVQENVRDDRPGFARVRRMALQPVR